mgnify:CR=1 FL=1
MKTLLTYTLLALLALILALGMYKYLFKAEIPVTPFERETDKYVPIYDTNQGKG